MRLSKEEFIKAINTFRDISREENKAASSLGIVEWKPMNWVNSYYELLLALCDFSEEELSDPSGTWLDYFCWELDFGALWKFGCVTIDGKDFPLQTAEDLWNLLQGEKEENA